MERKLYTSRSPFKNQQPGRVMRAGLFNSLMDDAACRSEALMAVGQQLRKRYDAHLNEPMPQGLQSQLQRLAVAERTRARRRDRSDI